MHVVDWDRGSTGVYCLFSPGCECDIVKAGAWSPRQAAPVSFHLCLFSPGRGFPVFTASLGPQAGWSGPTSSFALVPPFSTLTRQTDAAPDWAALGLPLAALQLLC